MLFKLLLFLILLLAPVTGAPIGNRNQRSIPENRIQGGDNIVLPNNSQDLMVIIAIAAIVFVLVITAAAISTLIYRLRKNNKSRRDEEGLWHADKNREYYVDCYSLCHFYKKRECSGRPKGEHEGKIKLIADEAPHGPKTENGDILEETKISVPGPPDVIIDMPDEDVVTASDKHQEDMVNIPPPPPPLPSYKTLFGQGTDMIGSEGSMSDDKKGCDLQPQHTQELPGYHLEYLSGDWEWTPVMDGCDWVTSADGEHEDKIQILTDDAPHGPETDNREILEETKIPVSGPPDVDISMPDEDVVTSSDEGEDNMEDVLLPPTNTNTCQCVNMRLLVDLYAYFRTKDGDLLPW
ncbi:uncharacterized protein ACNLHF_025795 [Anomaloglossus baeobatrachus]|uniref:uncharacterized protein LOC142246159 n=1 Tax=Anomaloglossus baeobatrachus TaxID=238106 RepID=UPI003F506E76